MRLLLAAFLAAHALIHASYLTPAPPQTAEGPQWPFELARSWLVTGLGLDLGFVRPLGIALVATTVVLFVAAAMATAGWIVPSAWWPVLVVSGAVSSVLTLALFFHPWLLLGFLIDAALLWAVSAGWRPFTAT